NMGTVLPFHSNGMERQHRPHVPPPDASYPDSTTPTFICYNTYNYHSQHKLPQRGIPMKTAAIITEYNPFHNGHAYQLSEVRKRSGADFLIIIMSGDYVQRGTPAILDKYVRTEAALLNGADLVLELPLPFATGSAQRFAGGAVSVLDGLGIVDELWFGSEEGDLKLFSDLTEILLREPESFQGYLKDALRAGLSYPAARSAALSAYASEQKELNSACINVREFLKKPNNILGLEYVLALKKRNSSIQPCTLKRSGSGYHEEQITAALSSATAIRASLTAGDLASIGTAVPENCLSLYTKKASAGALITENDLSEALRYQLWKESADSLLRIMDVNEDLANRILNLRPRFRDFSSFVELLQTRNQTRTAMQRALLHILLGITQDAVDLLPEQESTMEHIVHLPASGDNREHTVHLPASGDNREHIEHLPVQESTMGHTDLPAKDSTTDSRSSGNRQRLIRILGLSKDARSGCLLSGIPKDGPIAITANPGTHPLKEQYEQDRIASEYYQSLVTAKNGEAFIPEYSRKLIVI
ncbi:MAG: nucleotidyltransferase family protein, partial [Lachnospiraceae bacterium]|nr:nucleotidyltransferase family protein [Lachnospiraceae bacterium]